MSTYYTCDEVATMLRVKKITVWDWIRKGKLAAKKFGKSYRISDEDIQAFGVLIPGPSHTQSASE